MMKLSVILKENIISEGLQLMLEFNFYFFLDCLILEY